MWDWAVPSFGVGRLTLLKDLTRVEHFAPSLSAPPSAMTSFTGFFRIAVVPSTYFRISESEIFFE